MFESIDPSTGASYLRVELDAEGAIEGKLAAASAAYRDWRAYSMKDRAALLKKLATSIREDRERIAMLMTREMGKPIREARAETDKCAWCFEHYAEFAESYLAPVEIASDASKSYVQHLPLGPILGILPWNAPIWLAARSAAPALMAGNVVVLKHDSHVPGCAQALGEHAEKTLPPGVLQLVFTDNDGTEEVIRDKRIRGVSFTGSTRAGKIVAGIAGSELKPAVLELGGSDPAIVAQDADLEAACKAIVTSRIINAGQSCIAAKRIFVERPVYEEVLGNIRTRMEALKVGDPAHEDTDVGPLARADIRDNLHRQVTETIAAGAKCLLGGTLPETPGYFYPPTLLTDVPLNSPAFCEETFGPVAVVMAVDDIDQAIDLANQSDYGLAAAVWCDSARGEALAARLETGQVNVNGIVKTDPRLPSGGIKNSGLGRELGPHGIREFVNTQQVWVGPAKPA